MKKIIISGLVLGALAGGTFAAFAQTYNTSSTIVLQSLIDSLKQQIATLQAKIDAQTQANIAVRQAAANVSTTLSLIGQLHQGMSGDDVKTLQAILAADPEIFPEGKITGFFGKLTENAVKRFQKKHGLEQVGRVGPKTIEELNKELEGNPLSKEDDGDGQGEHPCAIIPPGHLIAPGWLRNKEDEKPIVPACQIVPPGIAEKLGMTTSTERGEGENENRKSFAPVVFSVGATNITATSATILWNTNESADSSVWYSTSSPVQATGTTPSVFSASLATSHSMALMGLTSMMTYHYIVSSKDSAGNMSSAGEYSFQTLAMATTTPLLISGISATSITSNSAHIVWTTNGSSTSNVWYSTSTPVNAASSTPSVSSANMVTNHDLALSGLSSSTLYYYIVSSVNASGTSAMSAQSSFATAMQQASGGGGY